MRIWIVLFVFLSFFGCSKNQTKIPLNSSGNIGIVVSVDSSFSNEEFQTIKSAAQEWFDATNGFVRIKVLYPADQNTKYHNLIIKSSSHHEYVEKREKEFKLEGKNLQITGFWYRPSFNSNWRIYLIHDRLANLQYMRTVVMHELGHAMMLDHRDVELGVMNASQDLVKVNCLTRNDLRELSRVYSVKIDSMHYCTP